MSVVNLASYKAVAATSRLPGCVDAPLPSVPRRCSRRVTVDLIRAFEIVCVIAGGLLPATIAAAGDPAAIDWLMMLRCGGAAALVSSLVLTATGHYDPAELPVIGDRPGLLLMALLIAIGAVIALGLPHSVGEAGLPTWAAAWVAASFTLLLAGRAIVRATCARLAAEGRFDRRIAIYGAGAFGRRVHDQLSEAGPGISIAGIFDDRSAPDRLKQEGLVAVGRSADLAAMARAGDIDEIIIAVPPNADRRIMEIARGLEQLPASIHIATHVAADFVDDGALPAVSSIAQVGMLDVKAKALTDWQLVVKRTEDVVLSLALFVIAAPLFPLIAAAIKLDSRGPVYFVQRRRGLNQRIINVLKFRTMHVLEDSGDVRQARPSDPRITRVGGFLRRSSLDELPQLLNVLAGQMSLVGPRPHALVHDEHYGELLETYANRHQVKPGITGLAQVRGHRGETSTPDKMQARVDSDIAYIKSWSLWLDMQILVKTVWAVALQRNAR